MGVDNERLTAELKLLNWHKLANEAALKAALLKTKQIKEKEAKKAPQNASSLRQQAEWMQRVIEEEQAKPLQVSKEFVTEYKEREKREEERLEYEVDRHIEALNRLKQQVAHREKMRAKREYYKRGRAELEALNSTEVEEEPEEKIPKETGGTLTNVISSLDRLVDLERRIASLEKDAIYDRVTQAAVAQQKSKIVRKAPSRSKRTIKFTKQRIPSTVSKPSNHMYSVRLGKHTINKKRIDHVSKRYSARSNRGLNPWLQPKKTTLPQKKMKILPKNQVRQQFIDMKRNIEKRKDTMRKAEALNASTKRRPPSKFYPKKPPATTMQNRPQRLTTQRDQRRPSFNQSHQKRAPPISSATRTAPSQKSTTRPGISRPSNAATNSLPLPHIAGSGVRVVRGVRGGTPTTSAPRNSMVRRR